MSQKSNGGEINLHHTLLKNILNRNDKSEHITHLDNVVRIIIVWSEWSDSNARPREPKSRALPTALHPDIQFFCMIPREEGKSKFLVSVGGAVVKPDFSEVFQPGNFHRNLLSQGLPGVRFQGNG